MFLKKCKYAFFSWRALTFVDGGNYSNALRCIDKCLKIGMDEVLQSAFKARVLLLNRDRTGAKEFIAGTLAKTKLPPPCPDDLSGYFYLNYLMNVIDGNPEMSSHFNEESRKAIHSNTARSMLNLL